MVDFPTFFPFGAVHHATFLKQSPPLGPDEYREFMRAEMRGMKSVGFNSFSMECGWADLEAEEGVWDFSYTDIVQELCGELDLHHRAPGRGRLQLHRRGHRCRR